MAALSLHFDLTQVLVAAVAVIPAIVAAMNSRKTKQHTATSNGTKLGELVEKLDRRLRRVEEKLETPSGDSIGEVAERTHDLAATVVAKTVLKKEEE